MTRDPVHIELPRDRRERLLIVVLFAAAMAWVEAACVYYVRLALDRLEPYQPHPLPFHGIVGPTELVRELSTLLMLLAVGLLAASTWPKRLAYTAIAFGVWDIGYYAFLRVIYGWPRSLVDWDILFLLPLPWWGPVAAPMSIAVLLIVWGTFVIQSTDPFRTAAVTWTAWSAAACGIALALYVFMVDSLLAVQRGADLQDVLPTTFNWPVFAVALALMAVPPARMFLMAVRPRARSEALSSSASISLP